MDPAVGALTDQQAIEAVKFVLQEWMKRAGPEALSIWQQLQRAAKIANVADGWAISASSDDPHAADFSRIILSSFLTADRGHPDIQRWTRDSLRAVTEARGNVLDPISLTLVGTISIGLILAARIKGAGRDGVSFYEGLPDSLAKVIKLVGLGSV